MQTELKKRFLKNFKPSAKNGGIYPCQNSPNYTTLLATEGCNIY